MKAGGWPRALAGIALSLTLACEVEQYGVLDSGKVTPADSGSVMRDGATGKSCNGEILYSCPTPGKTCDAHDPCARNPICGSDKRCYPQGCQDCGDGLACTKDVCLGQGMCQNLPNAGFCALPVRVGSATTIRCFKQGERNPAEPCQVCKPGVADAGAGSGSKTWTSATGGSCDDKDACTRNDICKAGVCAGTSYASKCTDGISCTKDLCDGKGGCLKHQLKLGWCLISGKCYADGAKHPSGTCFSCSASKAVAKWTAIANTCMIDSKCYKAGDAHPQGCAQCKPAASTTAWTLTSKTDCLIAGQCYKPNSKDKFGCAQCSPAKSQTTWTKIAGCFKIVFTTLNVAHTGNLGGVAGADKLCAQQAAKAGFSGTFKAFLSAKGRNVKDLIKGTQASGVVVINVKGEKMYNNWNTIFTSTAWASSVDVYSFNGTEVDEGKTTPDWYDADAWHGSTTAGVLKSGYTCSDWTSASSSQSGANGEIDMNDWLDTETTACDKTLAVPCVQVAP